MWILKLKAIAATVIAATAAVATVGVVSYGAIGHHSLRDSVSSFSASAQPQPFSGRVVDSNGNPVQNATVIALGYDITSQQQVFDSSIMPEVSPSYYSGNDKTSGPFTMITWRGQSCRTTSDASGAFHLAGMPIITKSPVDYNRCGCYVIVDNGTLTLLPAASVNITVTDTAGHPAAKVIMSAASISVAGHGYSLSPQSCPARWKRVSDDDGVITWTGLPQGCTVSAAIQDDRYAATEAQVTAPDSATPGDQRIVVSMGCDVTGRVVYGGTGKPVPNAHVHVIISNSTVNKQGNVTMTDERETGIGADGLGQYRLAHLIPGHYEIRALPAPTDRGTNQWISAPVNCDGQEGGLITAPNIDCVLAGLIRGKVTYFETGAPATGLGVCVSNSKIHLNNGPPRMSQAMTGIDGEYQLVVLPAPGYVVLVGPGQYTKQSYSQTVDVTEGTPAVANFAIHQPAGRN